jgi:hypothetical protein
MTKNPYSPSNWAVLSNAMVEEIAMVTARNNATGEFFSGTLAEFNTKIKKIVRPRRYENTFIVNSANPFVFDADADDFKILMNLNLSNDSAYLSKAVGLEVFDGTSWITSATSYKMTNIGNGLSPPGNTANLKLNYETLANSTSVPFICNLEIHKFDDTAFIANWNTLYKDASGYQNEFLVGLILASKITKMRISIFHMVEDPPETFTEYVSDEDRFVSGRIHLILD